MNDYLLAEYAGQGRRHVFTQGAVHMAMLISAFIHRYIRQCSSMCLHKVQVVGRSSVEVCIHPLDVPV